MRDQNLRHQNAQDKNARLEMQDHVCIFLSIVSSVLDAREAYSEMRRRYPSVHYMVYIFKSV